MKFEAKIEWTDEDDELLFVSYCEGLSVRAIQEELFPDRDLNSVKNRVAKLKSQNPNMFRGTSDDFFEKSQEYYVQNAIDGSRIYHRAMMNYYAKHGKKKGRKK